MAIQSLIEAQSQLNEALAYAASASLAQKASDQILADAIPVLQTLNESLQTAYTDYNGFRAIAVMNVTMPQNQLESALAFVGSGVATSTAIVTTPPPTTQAASDALLTAALPILQSTITNLEGANNDYGGRKAAAIQGLIDAQMEINEALSYAATHDQSATLIGGA